MVQKLRESTIYPGMSNFHSFRENADFSLDTVKASIKQAELKTNYILKDIKLSQMVYRYLPHTIGETTTAYRSIIVILI